MTSSTMSLRPYKTFADLERMISRTAFNQLNHSVLILLPALASLAIIYLFPPLLLFAGHWLPVVLGALACLLMVLAYLPIIRFYRLNFLWSFALPLTGIFYMYATFHSALKYWTGRGGEWKGRTIPA